MSRVLAAYAATIALMGGARPAVAGSDRPAGLLVIDIAWGVFVSTVSAAAGRAAWLGVARAG